MRNVYQPYFVPTNDEDNPFTSDLSFYKVRWDGRDGRWDGRLWYRWEISWDIDHEMVDCETDDKMVDGWLWERDGRWW